MKVILLSIQPEHIKNILNGKKTLEIRKKEPKHKLPIEIYLYCTKEKIGTKTKLRTQVYNGLKTYDSVDTCEVDNIKLNGTVVAKFTLNTIETIECSSEAHNKYAKPSCLTVDDFIRYCNGQDLYAWKIDDLVIFDKPKELSDFYITNPKIKKTRAKIWSLDDYYIPLKKAPQSYCYIEVQND